LIQRENNPFPSSDPPTKILCLTRHSAMARGRKPRQVRESVQDELRCAHTESKKSGSSFKRRRVGGAIREHNYTQSRFLLRPTKARIQQHKPLKFHPARQKSVFQLKPLCCYKRRRSGRLQARTTRELPPNPLSSPFTDVNGPSTASIQCLFSCMNLGSCNFFGSPGRLG
jgi:hypothetical protein